MLNSQALFLPFWQLHPQFSSWSSWISLPHARPWWHFSSMNASFGEEGNVCLWESLSLWRRWSQQRHWSEGSCSGKVKHLLARSSIPLAVKAQLRSSGGWTPANPTALLGEAALAAFPPGVLRCCILLASVLAAGWPPDELLSSLRLQQACSLKKMSQFGELNWCGGAEGIVPAGVKKGEVAPSL